MNRLFIHNPFFRIVSGLLYGVLAYMLILLINNTVSDINKIFSNKELYACIGLSYITFESMRVIISVFERRFQTVRQKLLAQIMSSLILSVGLVSLAISAYFRCIEGFSIGAA